MNELLDIEFESILGRQRVCFSRGNMKLDAIGNLLNIKSTTVTLSLSQNKNFFVVRCVLYLFKYNKLLWIDRNTGRVQQYILGNRLQGFSGENLFELPQAATRAV